MMVGQTREVAVAVVRSNQIPDTPQGELKELLMG